MDRLIICKTDKGRYSVRPIDWEGIWDKYGRIQENGLNHTAIFYEKEDAEFFVKAKEAEEQGKMLILPCKPGDTVYLLVNDGSNNPFIKKWKASTLLYCLSIVKKNRKKRIPDRARSAGSVGKDGE